MIKTLRLNQEDMRNHGFVLDRAYNPKQAVQSQQTAWCIAYSPALIALHTALLNCPMKDVGNGKVSVNVPLDTLAQIKALIEQYHAIGATHEQST